MQNNIHEFTLNINKLNKLFINSIDVSLRGNGINNVTYNQALLISNIGKNLRHVSESSCYGYYTGTNISYNVKDMVKKGYVDRIVDNDDKRCAFLCLTDKGLKVLDILEGANVSRKEALLKHKIDVNNINEILVRLHRIF